MPELSNFSWVTALVKGVRDSLIAIVPTAGAAIALAVFTAVEADDLATYGVPVWLVPALIGAFTAARNVLRNKLGWPVAIALVSFLGVGSANAQTFEGLTNPHFGVGASYLLGDQAEDTQRINLFLSATVPGIKIGSYPCYGGGVGLTGGGLDPSLSQISFGVAIPVLTCDLKGGQYGFQVGYARLLTGPEEKPDGVYLNATFSLTSPKEMEAKREAKRAKKRAQLMISHPTKTAILQ